MRGNMFNLALFGICLSVTPLNLMAHVRMSGRLQKFGTTILPIRNADAVGADGRASVGGPCGGVGTYNAENAPDVLNGGEVQLSLEYAAGHENPANVFTVTMACDEPSENDLRADNAKATVLTAAQCKTTQGGTTYPVPAPTGRDAKVVTCTLPEKRNEDLNGKSGHCSLSFQDQRRWGGCVDFKLVSEATLKKNAAAAAIAPPKPPEKTFISAQQVQNIVTSGPPPDNIPCCGLKYAKMTIEKGTTSDDTASAILLTGFAFGANCDEKLNFEGNRVQLTVDGKDEISEDNPLRLMGRPSEKSFTVEDKKRQIQVGNVPCELSYTAGHLSVKMLGDPSKNPTVCDSGINFAEKPIFGAECRKGGRCPDYLDSFGDMINPCFKLWMLLLLTISALNAWLP